MDLGRKMTREQMVEWIEALRSGEYEQYRGGIREQEGDGLCCLGVASYVFGFWSGAGVLQYPGYLFSVNPEYDEIYPGVKQSQCAHWNDAEKLSFEEIADRLEKIVEEQDEA